MFYSNKEGILINFIGNESCFYQISLSHLPRNKIKYFLQVYSYIHSLVMLCKLIILSNKRLCEYGNWI